VSADLELYVYYRVPDDPAALALAHAERATMAALLRGRWPGLRTRWLERTEIRDGMRTWMEIHRHPDGLDPQDVAHIGDLLSPWPSVRAGPRHVEVFATLPDSADRCA
jgi:hypothetical protein